MQENITSQLGNYSSASRLYALSFQYDRLKLGSSGLLVEAFASKDQINDIGSRDVILLSISAHIELKTLIGQTATLHTSLSDGSRSQFTGLIHQAANLGSEGGMARIRIRLVPWIWLLTQCRTNRVWQDKSVIAIVESGSPIILPTPPGAGVTKSPPSCNRRAIAAYVPNTANPIMISSAACSSKKALTGVSKKTRLPPAATALSSSLIARNCAPPHKTRK